MVGCKRSFRDYIKERLDFSKEFRTIQTACTKVQSNFRDLESIYYLIRSFHVQRRKWCIFYKTYKKVYYSKSEADKYCEELNTQNNK